MAPIQKISREMILEVGYMILAEEGIDSINSRNIAKHLGCSTQPIFSQFSNMEELKQAIHDYACQKFEDALSENIISSSFMQSSYLQLIKLAREKKNIFQLLFLSTYCTGENFLMERMSFRSNQRIWEELKVKYQLQDEECSNILERISLLVQGIATLMATSKFIYNDEQIIAIVETTTKDMVDGMIKRRG